MLTRQCLHAVVVDFFSLIEAIGHDLEPLAREIERHAVREVPALGEREAHDGVAGLKKGKKNSGVGLGPGVRLNIGRLASVQLL